MCKALHGANVDGEDVCSFSDEDWNILSKEHGLSSLIVRKLRRKCTLAAEVEVEQEPPPLPSASRWVWESDGAVLCDLLSSDRTFIKHLSKLKHSHSARETIDRH